MPVHRVGTVAAVQRIAPVAAEQRIVAALPRQDIVARTAIQLIVSRRSDQRVVSCIANQRVISCGTRNARIVVCDCELTLRIGDHHSERIDQVQKETLRSFVTRVPQNFDSDRPRQICGIEK